MKVKHGIKNRFFKIYTDRYLDSFLLIQKELNMFDIFYLANKHKISGNISFDIRRLDFVYFIKIN
jgi:hypothetical protein